MNDEARVTFLELSTMELIKKQNEVTKQFTDIMKRLRASPLFNQTGQTEVEKKREQDKNDKYKKNTTQEQPEKAEEKSAPNPPKPIKHKKGRNKLVLIPESQIDNGSDILDDSDDEPKKPTTSHSKYTKKIISTRKSAPEPKKSKSKVVESDSDDISF